MGEETLWSLHKSIKLIKEKHGNESVTGILDGCDDGKAIMESGGAPVLAPIVVWFG